LQGYTDPKTGSNEMARAIIAGMKADRQSMFGKQLLRTFLFAALVIGILFLYIRNVLKSTAVIVALGLVAIIDLVIIDKEYLSDENFVSADELATQNFTPTTIDQQILSDKSPDFRVYNNAPDWTTESRTSYFHK